MTRTLLLVTSLLAAPLSAQQTLVDLRQGTNLSVDFDPNSETLAIDLAGGLWTLPLTGGAARMLLEPGSGVAQPRFDPAGDQIVVERMLEDQWDLWLIERESGNAERLTDTPFDEREPDFSEDGRRVFFAANPTSTYAIWELNLTTQQTRQLIYEAGNSRFPTIGEGALLYVQDALGQSALKSRDGASRLRTLVTAGSPLGAPSPRPGAGVVIYRQSTPSSSTLKLLIEGDDNVVRPLTGDEDVFRGRVAWISPSEYVYAADGQLWRRTIGSTERRPIHLFASFATEARAPVLHRAPMDDPGPHAARGIRNLAASPDGERTAFAALGDLWITEGPEGLTRLTDDRWIDIEPRFAADGESIYFASDRSGKLEIWQVDLESRRLNQITTESDLAYAPRPTRDGRLYYLTTRGPGRWGRSELRLKDPANSGDSDVVADALFDVQTLSLENEEIRVRARNGTAGAALTDVFIATRSGDGAAPAADPTPLTSTQQRELTWKPAVPDAPYAIQVGRLFDGIGNGYLRHMDVHVDGQRITAIVGRNRLPLPDRVIDAQELTLVPGLIDVHVHQSALNAESLGPTWLAHGITTVRELAADPAAALERAEAWASGKRPGPRLVVAASGLGSTDYGALPTDNGDAITMGFAHVLKRGPADLVARLGATRPDLPEMILSPLNRSYQDVISLLVGSGRVAATGLSASAPVAPVSPLTGTIARLLRSSGRVAVASDAPFGAYGRGLHDELSLLAEAGLPNAQVLRLATAGGAFALGLDSQLGTLEAGKLADFVLVDGDPLARIEDLSRVVAVGKGGLLYSSDRRGASVGADFSDFTDLRTF